MNLCTLGIDVIGSHLRCNLGILQQLGYRLSSSPFLGQSAILAASSFTQNPSASFCHVSPLAPSQHPMTLAAGVELLTSRSKKVLSSPYLARTGATTLQQQEVGPHSQPLLGTQETCHCYTLCSNVIPKILLFGLEISHLIFWAPSPSANWYNNQLSRMHRVFPFCFSSFMTCLLCERALGCARETLAPDKKADLLEASANAMMSTDLRLLGIPKVAPSRPDLSLIARPLRGPDLPG